MQREQVNVEELRRGGVIALKERDMFSLWVKTACCNLNSAQLRKLADITDKYGRGFLLFSSRQIPIIPFIRLQDVAASKKELAEVEMELDRCGARVRNFNVCHEDKACPYAIVNCISLGEKVESFFRSEILHKIKIGIAGCRRDCVVTRVLSDIGFIGARSDNGARYDAYLGGRLGLNPFIGIRVAERLSEDGAVRFVQNYFDLMEQEGKPGERAADLINRLGAEKVKQELIKNLQDKTLPEPVACPTRLAEGETDKIILRIRATCGEVTTKQLRKIADIAGKYGLGFVHFAVRGAPEIPGVDIKCLADIVNELQEVNLQILDSGIDNLQTCYGRHCSESLADTQYLLAEVEKKVKGLGLNDLNIKVSAAGCPNSCGIPQLSDVGFHGIAEPEVNAKSCSACGLCIPVCKRKAIKIENGKVIIDKERCGYCGQCITVCPFDGMLEKRRGLAVLVGGKEGEDTRLGKVIAEFVSEEKALQIVGKCLKLMKEKNTGAAAIIDEMGIEKLRDILVADEK